MYSSILQYFEKTTKYFSDKVAFEDMQESYKFSDLEDTSKRIGAR